MDGWTEDLRGGLGHHSPPSVPTLRVEWTKCLLTGTNTQLFGDLPLGQPHTDTFNILSNTAIFSLSLVYKGRREEKEGCIEIMVTLASTCNLKKLHAGSLRLETVSTTM